MKVFYSRKAMIPVSLVVFGAVALFASPLGFTPAAFLIMVGIAAPIVLFMLWKEPPLTVAEVLHKVDTPRSGR